RFFGRRGGVGSGLGLFLVLRIERIVAQHPPLVAHALPSSLARSWRSAATPRKSRMVDLISYRGRKPMTSRARAPSATHRKRRKSRKLGGASNTCVAHSA